ncbi:acyl-CoA dehydrogenase family protein [Rhodococcus opacus]|uniref:Acyl-CoA dehydrogenase n=1 Tax=Rhodococcus opacus TaxID=37919 RepID=A0A2S8J4J4_RHOOP|nr:acyl-CoA dehydrogenase family protein [Rhodococcus opacus]PQP21981.1 acyl-CoA dehydrogenase [Rhodococcus opacus]
MFDIPEAVKPIRKQVGEFIETHLLPVEHELGHGGPPARTLLREIEQEAKAQGLYAIGHPERLGGGGLSMLDYAYVNEVIGRCEPAQQALGTVSLQTIVMLDSIANEEQVERWVKPATVGDLRIAFAVTEPDVGSADPTQLQTTAVLDGNEWILNGRKWFISAADRAAVTIVMAKTDPEAPPHRQFSMIFVPSDAPGYSVGEELNVMGLRSVLSGHYEVSLDNVRVPKENLIGGRGDGFTLAQQRLGPGRIYHCMRWLGVAQRAFDYLCTRANSRVMGGETLAHKQFIHQWVFDSYHEIASNRLLVLDAAAKVDAGQQARVELSAIKVSCAAMVNNVLDRAMQVHGAEGLTDRLPLELMFREARYGRIVDGPDEAHKQRVARNILKSYDQGSGWTFADV